MTGSEEAEGQLVEAVRRALRDVIRKCARHAKDFTQEKATSNHPLSDQQRRRNRTKSKVRSKVEHCFLVIKRLFGFNKVRYRGLAKNLH